MQSRTSTLRIVTVALIFPGGLSLPGQVSTGTITGVITDASGALVPKADVRITDTNTNVVRAINTDSEGIFLAANLLPGHYRVDVSRPGFQPQSKLGLILSLDQTLSVNFTLQPGEQRQTITVVGRAEQLLELETSSLGEIIDEEQIRNLPLNGRNFQLLLGLNAGVQPGPQGNFSQTVNITGGRGQANSYLIDGLDVTSPSNDQIRVQPNLEGIGEFKILTNTFSAEYGRSMGGIINAHVKSGTGEWHGSIFEFFRNRQLDARNFFDSSKPGYNFNQFGGAAGGPIVKNKLFVFGDYQGTRVRQAAAAFSTVATQAERDGDFSALLPQTVIYDPLTSPRAPFPRNTIPKSRFDKPSTLMFSLLPQPNAPLPFNFIASRRNPSASDNFDGRVDYYATQSDRLSSVITYGDGTTVLEPYLGPRLNGNLVSSIINTAPRSITINYTRVLSAAAVNEIVFGYKRDRFFGPPSPGTQYEPDAGIRFLNVSQSDSRTNGFPLYVAAGYSPFGAPAGSPFRQNHNIPQLADNFTWIRGRHIVKTGFSARARAFNMDQSTWSRGLLLFSPLSTSNAGAGGSALASALLGYPLVSQRDITPPWGERIKEYGAYFEDNFRVSRRLTLNLGVRWDLFEPATEQHNRLANFDLGTATLILAGTNGVSGSTLDTNYHDFSPRAGFAYTASSDRKTVLRGGYGIGYLPLVTSAVGAGSDRLTTNPPFRSNFATVYNFLAPSARVSDGMLLPVQDPKHPSGDVVFVQRDQPTPYVQQWTLDVQRVLPGNFVADMAYAAARGVHLTGAVNLNQARPGPTPPVGRSLISNAVNQVEGVLNRESSIYHSLQVKLERRFTAGLYVLAAYTFSKSIDDGSYTTQGSDASSPLPQDSLNWRVERALSDFDAKHRLVVSYIYPLPIGKGKPVLNNVNPLVNAITGDWQINGITVAQSGMPFTPVVATNRTNAGPGGAIRPDRIGSGELGAGQSIDHWFDVSAFLPQGAGGTSPYHFGNSGRNILRGPSLVNFDVSISKSFAISEGAALEFRSEFFNLFNHPNFGLPIASIDTPQAGAIRLARAPRQIQFGLKLLF